MKRSAVLGILRETKSNWERRCVLTPLLVSHLVRGGIQVLVQPSNHRVFTDEEYKNAGATITNDLEKASTIVGVKEPNAETLLPNKTYMFFGHVIKAQPYNMKLLDTLLAKNIRFVDYECIQNLASRQRLVAFGRFAGIAGMIDFCRGVGERLLTLGYMTPFLNMPSAYMFRNLDEARVAMRSVGEDIQRRGLPKELQPLVVTFTGSGKVSQGAQEMFELLPHEVVRYDELPDLVNSGSWNPRVLYKTVADVADYVENKNDPNTPFDMNHYLQHPSEYNAVFHKRYAPYTSLIVNCVYWDERFPRLITRDQMRKLHASGNHRLIALGDISCDIAGSIEWMDKLTTIQKPFYIYDPATETNVDELDAPGILVHSVDHLPAEVPVDASAHFGSALFPFIHSIVKSDMTLPYNEQVDLPPEIHQACITCHGSLTPQFAYIQQLRRMKSVNETVASVKHDVNVAFRLRGHLFDSGLINSALDLVEHSVCKVDILDFVPGGDITTPTNVVLRLSGSSEPEIMDVVGRLEMLIKVSPKSEATLTRLHPSHVAKYAHQSKGNKDMTHVPEGHGGSGTAVSSPKKNVLILGSGYVAGPVVDVLCRRGENRVTIASNMGAEHLVGPAANLISSGRASLIHLDVATQVDRLKALISESHIVVSLLPAPMHPSVARLCIESKVHLVTASYVSPEMRELEVDAQAAGISIMNEIGLDPGIDHMSALRIIRKAQSKGGKITRFTSSCGGLPAPEAANNPLGYKFSWSPRGVLRATKNAARFIENGKICDIPGDQLLANAKPVDINNAFNLEQLYNRDSIPYIEAYGLEQASLQTMFRGTLRYRGFSDIMLGLTKMGLTNEDSQDWLQPKTSPKWTEIMCKILKVDASKGDSVDYLSHSCEAALQQAGCNESVTYNTIRTMKWLGLFSAATKVNPKGTIVDTFCDLLETRLSFAPAERDMCLMHHEFDVLNNDGSVEHTTSTLIKYGNLDTGVSAMAKTVGVPAAISAQLILDGKIKQRGILTPMIQEIGDAILDELEEREGIVFSEHTVKA